MPQQSWILLKSFWEIPFVVVEEFILAQDLRRAKTNLQDPEHRS